MPFIQAAGFRSEKWESGLRVGGAAPLNLHFFSLLVPPPCSPTSLLKCLTVKNPRREMFFPKNIQNRPPVAKHLLLVFLYLYTIPPNSSSFSYSFPYSFASSSSNSPLPAHPYFAPPQLQFQLHLLFLSLFPVIHLLSLLPLLLLLLLSQLNHLFNHLLPTLHSYSSF